MIFRKKDMDVWWDFVGVLVKFKFEHPECTWVKYQLECTCVVHELSEVHIDGCEECCSDNYMCEIVRRGVSYRWW